MPTLAAARRAFAQLIVLSIVSPLLAGPFDAPAGYYDSATGTGSTLKSQLHNIIDSHTVFSYGAARTILQDTDQDPNDSDRLILVYDRTSLDVSVINPNGSIPGWDSGVSWNREHTWPRSRNVGSSGPDNSDLHQLRPSDNGINNSRGNLNFGGEFGQQGFGIVNDGGTFWYPGDADAGMIARQEFYMAVRYDGSDSSTDDLELVSGNPGTNSPHLGNLDRLIEWHYQAAPDDFERRRNDVIYDDYQGNRNPFVDHPEFVWSVFVDQQNDTQLTLAGESASADGSSTQSIDLGRVYVGGAAPASTTVALNKGGGDGTYYGVTTTGDAFTSAGEHARPLAMGGGVSDTFDVGLSLSTGSSGLYDGSVVIDNLDITTAGGSGRGANDGNDVIDLSFSVLDHPIASLVGSEIVSAMTIDFGSFEVGSGEIEQTTGLFNYNGAGAPAFASDLDVDSVSYAGDSDILSIDLLPSSGLEQGSASLFSILFDTTTVGEFASVVTINLSGEDLPGEQQQTLTLTLLGEATAPALLTGDYNGDGLVDAADFTVYRDTVGSTTDLRADGDASGEVDAADLALWSSNYGTSANDSLAIPEPSTLLLALFGYGYLSTAARRR